jgi:flagellar protein FliO/FliZ
VRLGRPRPYARLTTALVTALVVLLVAPTAVAAGFERDQTPLPASITDGSAGATAESSGGGGSYLRLVFGLLIVVALVFAVKWLLKRSQKGGGARAAGDLAVVATTTLAPNRSVHLLRVGDELVLVGSAEQGVTRLRVYDADESRTLLTALEEPAAPTGPRSLAQTLDELRRRTAR